ncbi:MAG: polyphosphate kinase 2 family protein [Phycisphaerae bacterium]
MGRLKQLRIDPGSKIRLADFETRDDGGLKREEAEAELQQVKARLIELEELLYADGRFALLIVFQAMDTGGKDSTIRSVFSGVNPASTRVVSYKAPNDVERRHDFLWRIHQNTPRLGHITIFNRSHYEDVLVVRVKSLVPEARWRARYDHINNFEQMLHDESTRVVKFFLHISKAFQKERLEKRLADPKKHWKFDPNDVAERKHWDDYQHAFEVMLERCSTDHAPWYVIPAETRWYRDLLVAKAVVKTLESLDLKFPKPTFDAATIHIDD